LALGQLLQEVKWVFVQFDIVALLLVWFMLAVAVVIVVYDLYHFIIPDSLTLALTVTSIAWVVLDMWPLLDLNALLLPIGSALLGSAFFLVLWLVSKGTWLGFGDVKLAFPLGLLAGPNLVFSFVVLSFWLGAAISLLLLGYGYLRRGKQALPNTSRGLTMKSAVPFAPFLVAGGLLVFFTNFDVLALFA
jgi:leader peptidase (prepilin peptidase)/N-methyltransferase